MVRAGERGRGASEDARNGAMGLLPGAWTTAAARRRTGCLEAPPVNQSRLALFATLRKNCEPFEFFWPVLAIESVPFLFDVRSMFSSLMLPPPERRSVSPVLRFLKVPSGGPPVPERFDLGSFEFGPVTLHYITLHYITLHFVTLYYWGPSSSGLRRGRGGSGAGTPAVR